MNPRAALAIAATVAVVMAWVAMGPRSDGPAPSHPPSASAVATVAPPAPAVPANPVAVANPPPRAARPSTPVARAERSRALGAAEPNPRAVPEPVLSGPLPEAAPPGPEAAQPGPELAVPRSTGAIRGLLHAADGHPLAGVSVVALAADGGDAAEDVTDGEGRCFLVALRPGRYAVFAGLGTPVASRVGGRGVTVEAGSVTPLTLDERRAGATVRVLALDVSGRPQAAQALLVPAIGEVPNALAALLASDGILLPGAARTVVEAVPPGRYTVVLLQGDAAVRAPAQVDVTGLDDLVVEVRLPPPVAVTAL